MSNDLRIALRKEADRLADEFYDRAMALLSAQVAGMFGGSSPNGVQKREVKSPEETEAVLAIVIETIRKHAGGLRLEGLRKETGLDKNVLGKAIRLGLESDQLTKTGQKRATTYKLPKRRS